MARDWASFDHWGTGNVDELRAYIGHLHRGRDALREENTALRTAATPVLAWLEWWLDERECECDGTHTCGWTERHAEAVALRAALDQEVSDE
jgi:hypothetical protein